MELAKALIIILGSLFIGDLVSGLMSIPVPGTIIGMLVLLILLVTRLVKEEDVEKPATFLLDNMAIFFVPSAVGLINSYKYLLGHVGEMLIILIIPSILTMGITALVVKKIMGDSND